jgi:alpha-tubulin suppressor-like RCC1 family protein
MKKLLLALFTVFTLQSQAQCWKEVKSGYETMAGIKEDGTLWTWGSSSWNMLGYENTTMDMQWYPKQVGVDTGWKQIDFGLQFMLVLNEDGTIWAAGEEPFLGFPEDNSLLLQLGTSSGWKAFSCGEHFALLLKNDGTLWGIGGNGYSQLGLGDSGPEAYFNSPVQIGTDNGWKDIAAGDEYSLAVKNDGTLWNWGQLPWANSGDIIFEPTQVGTDTDWQSVETGYQSNAAIKNNGTLWTWGRNGIGELGLGDQIYYYSEPTQLGTDTWTYVNISAASMHGVKTNGKLYGWGSYYAGQLGNGMYGTSDAIYSFSTPTLIFSETGWEAYGSKYNFFTALLNENGTLKACGKYGYLGFKDASQIIFVSSMPTGIIPTPHIVTCNAIAGLNDNTLSQITLYPNPTSSMLTLANAKNLTVESLTVTDMTGKVVLSQNGNNSQIDVEKLPAGIYFLTVSAKEGVQNMKFIKE